MMGPMENRKDHVLRLERCSDRVKTAINSVRRYPSAHGYSAEKLEAMRRIAEAWDGECLSSEYRNSCTPLVFRCREQHTFSRIADKILYGYFCSICDSRPVKKLRYWQDWASSRGWTCLSTTYVNRTTPLRWRCSRGHEWTITGNSLKQTPVCPTCQGRRHHSLESMKALARERGGDCLSERYVNPHHKLEWVCHRGHHWIAEPNSVIRGSWCPQCANMARIRKPGSPAWLKYSCSSGS